MNEIIINNNSNGLMININNLSKDQTIRKTQILDNGNMIILSIVNPEKNKNSIDKIIEKFNDNNFFHLVKCINVFFKVGKIAFLNCYRKKGESKKKGKKSDRKIKGENNE